MLFQLFIQKAIGQGDRPIYMAYGSECDVYVRFGGGASCVTLDLLDCIGRTLSSVYSRSRLEMLN